MSDCPSAAEWNEFLAESLAASERTALSVHLTRCAACQATLDRLAEPAGSEALTSSGWATEASATSVDLPLRLRDRLLEIVRSTSASGVSQSLDMMARGTCVGDFVIESEIGRGGMGVVYRARDSQLGRAVALKVVHRTSGAPASFCREAAAAARVRHDHVVPVLSAGMTAAGQAYLAMPYIEGPTLRQILERDRVIAPRQAAEFARQIADALGAVHDAGLVHRDVKPENVLIDRLDQRAKLTDFGLARDDGRVSRSTRIAGTPEYLSPEQIATPNAVSAATDVYSLGVTLYEAVTGTTPFRGPPHHVLQRIVSEEPPRPRTMNADVPLDLETIILTAMASSPARRYASARALRDDLARWLAGAPLVARPAGRIERAWKWARRHPWQTVATGCAVALGIGLLGAVAVERQFAAKIAQANAELADKVEELSATNRQLAFAREDAEKAYRLSRIGVNRTTTMMKERLADLPNSGALTLDLLKATHDTYRQLSELRPADGEMAALYLDSLRDLTNALARTGQVDEAAPVLDRFAAELGRQRDRNPQDPNLSVGELELLRSRERLLRGRGAGNESVAAELATASAEFQQALDRVAVERPNDPRVLSLLFERESERMVAVGRSGDNAGAQAACLASVAIGERWRAAAPRDPTAARQLALQLGFLAMISTDLKRFDDALEAADKLERVCDDPVHPAGGSLAYRRGIVWLVRGMVAKETGNLESAAAHLAQAETIYRQACAEHPREYNLRTQLATVLARAGTIAAQRDLRDPAQKFFGESCSLLRKLIAEYPSDTVLPKQLSDIETEWKRLEKPTP